MGFRKMGTDTHAGGEAIAIASRSYRAGTGKKKKGLNAGERSPPKTTELVVRIYSRARSRNKSKQDKRKSQGEDCAE